MAKHEVARILVVGSVNMDLVFRVARAPEEGETLIGTEYRQVPGGKGANQAVAAARLGAEVVLVARVGGDSLGSALIESLNKAGVDTRLIRRDPEVSSGVASITLDARGNNRIVVFPGANGRLTAADVESAWGQKGRVDAVVLQLETPLPAVERAAELAVAEGLPVILNPAPACPLAPSAIAKVSILTPNESEAETLTGLKVVDVASAAAAAARLRQCGAASAVVTMGSRGVVLLDADGTEHIPARRVPVVDTVAAGDAFTGALAVGVGEGSSLREAARYANAVAALAVTKPGAQDAMPTRAEVDAFLARAGEQ